MVSPRIKAAIIFIVMVSAFCSCATPAKETNNAPNADELSTGMPPGIFSKYDSVAVIFKKTSIIQDEKYASYYNIVHETLENNLRLCGFSRIYDEKNKLKAKLWIQIKVLKDFEFNSAQVWLHVQFINAKTKKVIEQMTAIGEKTISFRMNDYYWSPSDADILGLALKQINEFIQINQ